MNTREATLPTGETFTVPQGIQRLDSRSTRGWQVRYQGTKYFADGTAGAKASLDAATRELMRRIATLPAPTGIKRTPSPNKTSTLPVGISGPIVITKSGTSQLSAALSVAIPRFGQTSTTRDIHIGTPNTYTKTRFKAALAKAIVMRQEALEQYEADATKAKRRAANELKRALRAARGV